VYTITLVGKGTYKSQRPERAYRFEILRNQRQLTTIEVAETRIRLPMLGKYLGSCKATMLGIKLGRIFPITE
jgi:hypothetical protein